MKNKPYFINRICLSLYILDWIHFSVLAVNTSLGYTYWLLSMKFIYLYIDVSILKCTIYNLNNNIYIFFKCKQLYKYNCGRPTQNNKWKILLYNE